MPGTMGLRSIHAHLGEGYGRVRLGIGHPGHKDAVAGYVLHNFAKADQVWLHDLLRGIAAGAPDLADGRQRPFHERGGIAAEPAPPLGPKSRHRDASSQNARARSPGA